MSTSMWSRQRWIVVKERATYAFMNGTQRCVIGYGLWSMPVGSVAGDIN